MMLNLRFTSRYLIPTCHLISDALRFHDILDPARGKPITITKCFHQSAILHRHWSPENVAEYRMLSFFRPIYRIVCANCEHKCIYSDIRHRQFRTKNVAFHGNYFSIFVRGIKNLPQQHGYYILISCFFGNFLKKSIRFRYPWVSPYMSIACVCASRIRSKTRKWRAHVLQLVCSSVDSCVIRQLHVRQGLEQNKHTRTRNKIPI